VDVDNEQIRVVFSVHSAIVDAVLSKQKINFELNGNPASRTQFPIQNAFGITVHKTQGLTLPSISVCLDQQIFAHGQAYVTLGRCAKWEDLRINSLSREAFMVDQLMVREYARPEEIAAKSFPINNNS
ncbi:2471_t:CDS:1, partial [Entrophospora sp. SA101]